MVDRSYRDKMRERKSYEDIEQAKSELPEFKIEDEDDDIDDFDDLVYDDEE